MDFEIKSHKEYGIVFSERAYDKKGWLTDYLVSLYSPNMSGAIRVDNAPYGQSPLKLFESIEKEWKGWQGEKSWGSLEGEFNISAISDKTGHITLKARIASGHYVPSARLETELIVEAGQVEGILKKAKAFFGC